MQLDWVARFEAGDADAGAMLTALTPQAVRDQLVADGSDPAAAMAAKINDKHTQFQMLVATANGVKAEAQLAINSAQTEADLLSALATLEATEAAAFTEFLNAVTTAQTQTTTTNGGTNA